MLRLAAGMIVMTFSLQAGEKSPPLRLAVLDLDSPANLPWLGPAVSAAIRTKLVGLEGVTLLERERIDEILLAKKDQPLTPAMLGTDYLLRGSVQFVGTWPDENAKVRINAGIVSAKTAKMKSDATFVIDGTVKNLFDLETDLATRFAKAVGKEPAQLLVRYRESKNLKAKRFFGEGLLKLRASEVIITETRATSDAAKDKGAAGEEVPGESASPVSQSLAPEKRVKVDALLRDAVVLFRQAQRENEGHFFARAHTYEGRARELLAMSQADDAQAQAVRDETVKQFRADAAEAAPALYDLGRALQVNGEYDEASDAYHEYLRWMKESNRFILWTKDFRFREFRSVLSDCWPTVREDHMRAVHADGRLYLLAGNEEEKVLAIVCLDAKTGETIWENRRVPAELPPTSFGSVHHDADKHYWYTAERSPLMAVIEGRVYWYASDALCLLDAATGRETMRMEVPLPYPETEAYMYEAFHVPCVAPGRIVVAREFSEYFPAGLKESASYAVVDIEKKKILWTGDKKIRRVWSGAVWEGDWREHESPRALVDGRPVKVASALEGSLKDYEIHGSRHVPDVAYCYKGSFPEKLRRIRLKDGIWTAEDVPDFTILQILNGTFYSRLEMSARNQFDKRREDWVSQVRKGWIMMWSESERAFRHVHLPESLSERVCRLSSAYQCNCLQEPQYMDSRLVDDRIWILEDADSGRQSVWTLDGKLVGSHQYGNRSTRRLFMPDATMIVLYKHQISRARLTYPVQGAVSEVHLRLKTAECHLARQRYEDVLKETDRIGAGAAHIPQAEWLAAKAHEALGRKREALNAYYQCFDHSPRGDARGKKALAQVNTRVPVTVYWRDMVDKACGPDEKLAFDGMRLFVEDATCLINAVKRRGDIPSKTYVDLNAGRIINTCPALGYGVHLGDDRFLYWDGENDAHYFFDARTNQTSGHVVPQLSQEDRDGSVFGTNANYPILRHALTHGVMLRYKRLNDAENTHDDEVVAEILATDAKTGRLLWRQSTACLHNDLSGNCVMAGDRLLLCCTSVSNEPAGVFMAIDVGTGEITARSEWPLGRKSDQEPVPPFQRMGHFWDTNGPPVLWNGLLIVRDFRKILYGIDIETGEMHPFPESLFIRKEIDVGLRGEARLTALKDPESYLKKHPQIVRRYLGEEGKSPYFEAGEKWMLLHSADGKKAVEAMPFMGYRFWPHPIGKDRLVFWHYGERFVVVNKTAFLRYFGIGPATPRKK